MTIASPHNEQIKQLRKLAQRKHRERSGLFVAEGEDMLAEALRAGVRPQGVFVAADSTEQMRALIDGLDDDVELVEVTLDVLASVSALGSGTRLIGVWPECWSGLGDLTQRARIIYLHDVADPGNVGTCIRAAYGFEAAVALSEHAADPFSPKAVRASMGAIFAVPVVRANFEDVRAALGDRPSVALVPAAGRRLDEVGLESGLFALGAERAGLPDRIVSACDEIAQIPLSETGPSSLNVAMAATLCLYESATRLHRLRKSP